MPTCMQQVDLHTVVRAFEVAAMAGCWVTTTTDGASATVYLLLKDLQPSRS